MGNRIWIEAQFPDLFSRLAVIGFVDSVREQEFRLTLGSVAFDRNDHSGPDEDSIGFLLGDYDAAFFNSEPFTQASWHDDRAAFADFCRLHDESPAFTECLIIRYARHSGKSPEERTAQVRC